MEVEAQAFDDAIVRLDKAPDADQARNLLGSMTASYQWDLENKNVPTLYGHIDVMTNDRIYVIKSIDEWCAGIGLLEVFRQSFPNKTKCLHLYNIGIQPNTLNKIITIHVANMQNRIMSILVYLWTMTS